VKTCTKCQGSMKAFCKLDGSKYRISSCAKCGRTFCDYCLIAADTKFANGNIVKRRKFSPPVCMSCYRKYYE